MTLEELFTLENLNNAFYESSKISHWKGSVQSYKANLLINNIELQEDLLSGNYKVSASTNFTINERGKIRHIEAPSQRDRIVQKVLCQQILIPQLTKPLIYDNYASLKNRGTSFARKRIEVLLRRYVRENGNEGYVLKIDIRKYFESIDHKVLKDMVHKQIREPTKVMDLIDYIIDTSSNTDKGLNLGSEAPQIFAIFYLSRVDNFVKSVLGVKYYGRYMDDIFIICKDKEKLKEILAKIKEQLKDLGLEVNERKTCITKLSKGFTYMQIKYFVNGNKIIKRPTRSKIVRERRRLKKYKKKCNLGTMGELEIRNCYKSWRNNILKDCKHSKRSIRRMDNLYNKLFKKKELYKRLSRTELIDSIFENEERIYEVFSTH